MTPKPNLFHYSDYRACLKDLFAYEKARNPKFSHRYLANRMGLSTSNFMLLVIQGKRNLAPDTCRALMNAFKFTPREIDYFDTLVRFCQTQSQDEKERHHNRLLSLRQECRVERIEDRQFEYFSKWYHPVIRELIADNAFSGDPKAIARRIHPKISLREVKASVKLLLQLGLIKKTPSGYSRSAPFISTGPEVNSIAVARYHKSMAELARNAISDFPRSERNVSSCLVRLSSEGYRQMTEKINEFRKSVLAIAQADQSPDLVYCMNFQLFPLLKPTQVGASK